MRFALIFLLCLPLTVQAEIYRCERAERTIYTDKPCHKGAKPAALPELDYIGSPEGAATPKAGKIWRPSPASRAQTAQDKSSQVLSGLSENKVVKGMSPEQVRAVLGEPDTQNLQTGRENITVWSYRPEQGPRYTISFRAGEVNSIYRRSGGTRRK